MKYIFNEDKSSYQKLNFKSESELESEEIKIVIKIST